MSNTPSELKYVATHEWVSVEENGIVTVGITDHAQGLLGDMVFVELPEVGDAITTGDDVAVAESVKAASDIYAPVTGEVVEINEALEDSPELVNSDAFGEGWLFKVKVEDLSELETLLDAEAYANSIED
ncbi:glycine cleavage system protein GcvH [Colwellia echini]|uniref:Glycine cleavage system H protein n=1 Tax=Colwellia echini TaxID=1982103 RepID=A0ABY3MVT3_9GAMM|nr:glycine cleavage system protein GcvH [Colwellia echini]TYK65167.1 glycine cleavage system protein GcvH [Colwellia echini]